MAFGLNHSASNKIYFNKYNQFYSISSTTQAGGLMANCSRCDGLGTTTCPKCIINGKPQLTANKIGDEDCSICVGTGEIVCPTCKGSGKPRAVAL